MNPSTNQWHWLYQPILNMELMQVDEFTHHKTSPLRGMSRLHLSIIQEARLFEENH
jgi:hypothetical protein